MQSFLAYFMEGKKEYGMKLMLVTFKLPSVLSYLKFLCMAGVSCTSNSLSEMPPMVQDAGVVVVIMGVSGAGKSTIGNLLAEALNCPFLDADDFHPQSNKEKMSKGIPLSDDDRMPWLQVLCQALKEYITCGKRAVLACSALRNKYRETLRTSDPSYIPGGPCSSLKFVLLDVPVEVLTDRLNKRLAEGQHFMPPNLLKSQLELLEIDASESVIEVDATQTPSVIVDIIKVVLNTPREDGLKVVT
ncbi:hypothetical protein KSS87_003799 [Heliosperma pusillum]|nr:hypothetical protein KSS87_003799 [Heliosperma pusillum]